MSEYRVLGVNDDKNFCACCGKNPLKRVVWLEHVESGDIAHYGINCAALLILPKNKKGAKGMAAIENAALATLKTLRDDAADKFWNESSHQIFCDKVAEYLLQQNPNLERDYAFVTGKTDVFCNFIWPYQKRQKK